MKRRNFIQSLISLPLLDKFVLSKPVDTNPNIETIVNDLTYRSSVSRLDMVYSDINSVYAPSLVKALNRQLVLNLHYTGQFFNLKAGSKINLQTLITLNKTKAKLDIKNGIVLVDQDYKNGKCSITIEASNEGFIISAL